MYTVSPEEPYMYVCYTVCKCMIIEFSGVKMRMEEQFNVCVCVC